MQLMALEQLCMLLLMLLVILRGVYLTLFQNLVKMQVVLNIVLKRLKCIQNHIGFCVFKFMFTTFFRCPPHVYYFFKLATPVGSVSIMC